MLTQDELKSYFLSYAFRENVLIPMDTEMDDPILIILNRGFDLSVLRNLE